MSLFVTNLSYVNAGNCKHLKIDYEEDSVPKSFNKGHEDSILADLKEIANTYGFRDKEEEFLIIVWLTLMLKIRGKTKANCYNHELDAPDV